MSEEDEKLQKHLIDEMMKVSKTNPDVMIYMGILMKNYEKLEEEIKRLNNIINELEKWLDKKEKLTFNSWNKGIHEVQRKLQELKGSDKE